jgi:hypothetical protein
MYATFEKFLCKIWLTSVRMSRQLGALSGPAEERDAFCPRADPNGHKWTVWVGPLEMPLYAPCNFIDILGNWIHDARQRFKILTRVAVVPAFAVI